MIGSDQIRRSYVIVPASWTVGKVRAWLNGRLYSHVIVLRIEPRETFYYLYTGDQAGIAFRNRDPRLSVFDALELREWKRSDVVDADVAALPVPERAVVLRRGNVVGFIDPTPDDQGPTRAIGRSGSVVRGSGTGGEVRGGPRAVAREGGGESFSVPTPRDGDAVHREREAPPPFSAYPRLDAPPRAIPNDVIDVVVGFRADQDSTLPGAAPINIAAPRQGASVFIVLWAEGGTIQGANSAIIPLSMTAGHTFQVVVGAEAHEIVLTAQFFYELLPVGLARRTVAVAAGAVAVAPNPCPMEAVESTSAVDATITVRLRDDGWVAWCLVAPSPPLKLAPEPVKLSDTREFAAQLDTDQRSYDYAGPFAHGALESASQSIASKVPAEIFDGLRRIHETLGSTPVVLLLTDEPNIPWELARWPAPLLDPAAPPILAAQVSIGRWWIDNEIVACPPATVTARKLTAVAAGYGGGQPHLPSALAEQAVLVQNYDAEARDATLAGIAPLITSPNVPGHFVHFAVHGYSHPNANEQALVLADNKDLRPGALVGAYTCGAVPRFSFVFLNACQVAAAGSRLGQAAGFPGAIIRGGALGFVAPLWQVDDDAARTIAERFYEEVFDSRRPVGEVLVATRKSYDPARTTTPLAYIFYGHPLLRIDRPAG
ncbi:MAG: CHAT domain-containing protein [Gemmatimonadota bacterium]